MNSVPGGPEHRSQRETASTLFLLLAEEEQAEKQRKVREMEKMRKDPVGEIDDKELQWALGIATQLNQALMAEDFRRPHHQLWKIIGPGLLKKDADNVFEEIRQLVWDKWNPIAWNRGYRTNWDKSARRSLCGRIVDVANHGEGKEVRTVLREIEDRCVLEWPEIPEAIDRPRYDETWNYHRREDGTWGTYSGPTTI